MTTRPQSKRAKAIISWCICVLQVAIPTTAVATRLYTFRYAIVRHNTRSHRGRKATRESLSALSWCVSCRLFWPSLHLSAYSPKRLKTPAVNKPPQRNAPLKGSKVITEFLFFLLFSLRKTHNINHFRHEVRFSRPFLRKR